MKKLTYREREMIFNLIMQELRKGKRSSFVSGEKGDKILLSIKEKTGIKE
jgi:hypothetical protein